MCSKNHLERTDGNNSGNDNNGGSNSNNDDDCETTGTIIQGSVPLTGIDGGCAPNDILGIIPDVEADDCIVSPAIENMVLNCIVDNSFLEPELQSFLLDPENACTLGEIALFLGNNGGCSEENENFVELAIEAMDDDDIEDGIVDFENEVILDDSFVETETQCIHNLLKSSNNLYSDMLSNFSSNEARGVLKLKVGETPTNHWGTTIGDFDNYNEFVITTSSEIENSTNLMRMVTLSHELIHAYLLSSLEEWNYIFYDINGEPHLNIGCTIGADYSGLNLNTLTIKQRFVAIICAFNQNNTLTEEWTHELFNVWEFDTGIYRERLKDLLINEHNWENENAAFKNEAISVFGESNWIDEVANVSAWIGLENTEE